MSNFLWGQEHWQETQSHPRCPPNKLSESRGDQPLVRSTRGRSTGQLSRSYLRRLRSTRSTDYSSRLLRTRYRLGQLDTWFWVVLLRVLRFPPLFSKRFEKNTRKKRDKRKDSKRQN